MKWRADRAEEFLAAHMARDQHYRAALALDRDGRILALRMEMLANIGAVPVGSSAMIPLAMVAKVATSAYRVPLVDYRVKGALTNTMATGAYAALDGRKEITSSSGCWKKRSRWASTESSCAVATCSRPRSSLQDPRRRDVRQR